MSYKITGPNNQVGPPSFESFWLYYPFTVSGQGVMTVQTMFWSVYFSESSKSVNINRPTRALGKYELADSTTAATNFQIHHTALVDSRAFEFASEYGQLHLFQCRTAAPPQVPANWLTAGSWNPNFTTPPGCDRPDTPFIKHELSLVNGPQARYAYHVMSRETGNGVRSISVLMPFLVNSVFSRLLISHGGVTPTLKLTRSVDGGERTEWEYFNNPPLPTTAVRGFCMVAQGAFKNIELNATLDHWVDANSGADPIETIGDHLSRIVYAHPPFKRTLATAYDTRNDSIIQTDSQPALEVLFLKNLNASAQVPRLL